MTLKVGQAYKARNGKAVVIIEDLKAGLFRGDIGDDRSVVYRANGETFTMGWSEWSIDGLSEDKAADRLDKLEAMCTDLFRQLRNVRDKVGQNSDLIAALASKTDEDIARLDGTDRRVAALHEGLNTIAHDNDGFEKALSMIRADIGALAPFRPKSVDDRISSVEATLARIEDMLTAEKPAVPKGYVANHPDVMACGNPTCGQCYTPKRVIKGGWVNFYPDEGWLPSFHRTRELADKSAGALRFACIKIPDITEGEGLDNQIMPGHPSWEERN